MQNGNLKRGLRERSGDLGEEDGLLSVHSVIEDSIRLKISLNIRIRLGM